VVIHRRRTRVVASGRRPVGLSVRRMVQSGAWCSAYEVQSVEVRQMAAIVVGYVDKPEGRAALQRAAAEARLRRARLVVVNTQSVADPATDEALAAVQAELTEVGLAHEVRAPAPGLDPAEDLIAVAGEVAADFIVIGLRRRSPVGKLILGSNAQRVLLDASCPVLAVKADEGNR
jgi:nucleotide-binding universal stress UspA family protein